MKKKGLIALTLVLSILLLTNLRWLGYLVHLAQHQVRVIIGSQAIEQRLGTAGISPEERLALESTLRIRRFAEQSYGLQNSKSYRRFFDLGRKYLGYNITLAPEFSLKPESFHFWPIGSFDYLGFFSREEADRWAESYRNRGYDVYLSEIGGYSTLGWFEDPLYSSQLTWGEFGLARLLGHEIAHERLYFSDDTTSSEIIASFIERPFALEYYAKQGHKIPSENEIRLIQKRMQKLNEEFDRLRQDLQRLYATNLESTEKRARKVQLFAQFHARLTDRRGPYSGLPAVKTLPRPENMNNAWLVQVHRYNPQNEALHMVLQKCRSGKIEQGYQCWFAALDGLKKCTPQKRRAWLKGSGAAIESYCRH